MTDFIVLDHEYYEEVVDLSEVQFVKFYKQRKKIDGIMCRLYFKNRASEEIRLNKENYKKLKKQLEQK